MKTLERWTDAQIARERRRAALTRTLRVCAKINEDWHETHDEQRYLVNCTRLWNAIDCSENDLCDLLWDVMKIMLPHFFPYQSDGSSSSEAIKTNSVPFTYYSGADA